eukprot:6348632-Amphidinium_carterae.2
MFHIGKKNTLCAKPSSDMHQQGVLPGALCFFEVLAVITSGRRHARRDILLCSRFGGEGVWERGAQRHKGYCCHRVWQAKGATC